MASCTTAVVWLMAACTAGAVLTSDKKPGEKPHVVARSYSTFERRITTAAVPPPPFYDRRPPPPPPPRRHRPHAAAAPPYAVQMEPVVQYSQFDPLFHHQHRQDVDGKLTDTSTHNELKDVKKTSSTPSLPADHSHKSNQHSSSSDADSVRDHDIAGSDLFPAYPDTINKQVPYHVSAPYYLKEPEPIIEIIIQESNVTLPPPPVLPPKPPTREPIQVFYVKYKKDPTKVGKDGEESVIYENPIPAITPATTSHLEETPPPPPEHPPAHPPPPLPTTTLRTIIHPDSEVYYGDSKIRVSFGTPHDEQEQEQQEQEQSAPQPAVALPSQQAEQRQGVNFPTYQHKKYPETFQPPPAPRNIPFQGQARHPEAQFQRPPPQSSFFPPGPQPHPLHATHNLRPRQNFNHQQLPHVPHSHFGASQQEQRLPPQQFPPPPPPPQAPGIQHQPQVSQERPRFQQPRAQSSPLLQPNNVPPRPTFPSTHFPLPSPSQPRLQPEQQFLAQQQFRNLQQNIPQQQQQQLHQQQQQQQQLHQQQLFQQYQQQQQSRAPPQNPFPQQQNRGFVQQQLQQNQKPQQQVQPHNIPQQQTIFQQQPTIQQQPTYQQQHNTLNQGDHIQKQLQNLQQQRLQNLQQHQRQEFLKQTQGHSEQHDHNQFTNRQQQNSGKPSFPVDPNAFRGELIKSLPKYEEHIVESTPTSVPRSNFQASNNLAHLNNPRQNNNLNGVKQIQQPTEQVSYRQLPPASSRQQQVSTPATVSSTSGYRPFPPFTPTQASAARRPAKDSKNSSDEHKAPDPKALAALPDEVPEELRQQLIASGVLSNADIQVLDYDKIGDIPIDKLPPEALANFYNAGGSAAAASAPVPVVVSPNATRAPVEMKVVRYNPETEEGQAIEEKYVKDGATQLEPVVLNDSTYNRYLPLKVSGAQFPLPDVPELRGRNVTSVVVLAPVTYDFQGNNSGGGGGAESREGRDAPLEVQAVRFLSGDSLRAVVRRPSADNYRRWLDQERRTAPDMQSIVLLVSQPEAPAASNNGTKDIFMYDVSTGGVSRLKGELSAAFVEVAEENAQADELDSAETMRMERRQPAPASASPSISAGYSRTAGGTAS